MNLQSDLNLSTRTARILTEMQVKTLDDFLSLDRRRIVTWPTSGAKTWDEISEAQKRLTSDEALPSAGHELANAAAALNRLLINRRRTFKLDIDKDGLAVIYRRIT